MPDLSFWTEPFAENIIETALSHSMLAEIKNIQFVRHFDEPSEQTLYVGMPEEVKSVLEYKQMPFGITFFISGELGLLCNPVTQSGHNLICVQMELLDIYECLSVVLQRYRYWSETLIDAAETRHSVKDIVKAGAALAKADIFLLNSANRIIYADTCADIKSTLTDELLTSGGLTPELVRHLGLSLSEDESIRLLDNEEHACWVYSAKRNTPIVSTMLAFAPPEQSRIDMQTLLTSVLITISRTISSTEQDSNHWAGTDFKLLVDDILLQRVTDENEINQRFSVITPLPQRFCSFVVIEFPTTHSISVHLLAQLEYFFPNSNVAPNNHSIVMLLSRPDRVFQPFPVFDEAGFNALLCEHDAYAAISNATSKRTMLRTALVLAQSTLQIAKALSLQRTRRVYFFEDFADYILIDLCITSFQNLLGHDDLIYLTHPDVVKLYRYDVAHRETLLDVLYYYCLNNMSIAKTAKSAYMHRNTVAAKVRRIGELIGADLTNGQIRQRLIFSYKILRYCERYAKIDILERLSEQRDAPRNSWK